MAETRWISIEPTVGRILAQWDSLKAHFDILRLSEHCYTAVLYSMFSDITNKIYLQFLYTILEMVQKTNKS
jgi:hypothetical protein